MAVANEGRVVIPDSEICCPCGFKSVERMPVNACQFFYDCKSCGVRLKPRAGDCCVFCSYGSAPCPPMQSGQGCG
ncbi:MAG TPA: GDCCVxC domain-containing (seleno)protein [Xanthobacteraceae bacterium]|nr:GDCCVxC domain-containing (seleno)protein [Xanthobacteraceae bacterium]